MITAKEAREITKQATGDELEAIELAVREAAENQKTFTTISAPVNAAIKSTLEGLGFEVTEGSQRDNPPYTAEISWRERF